VKVQHLGHACLLVDIDGVRLLIDPGTMSAFEDVRDLDGVLITHQHADHVDIAGLAALRKANPRATVWLDADTAVMVDGEVARPGQRFHVGDVAVDVLGGIHAAVYGDVPGCTNAAYLIGDGALLHPGDSFVVPERDVDVLAVAIDGPWLKISEAVDYVRAVHPRVAIPIHEGETTDPDKYAGMLAAFAPPGVVRPLGTDGQEL
jgi:L-ascorbate metabolism protein UlaG (beta-lactamase superfamily)